MHAYTRDTVTTSNHLLTLLMYEYSLRMHDHWLRMHARHVAVLVLSVVRPCGAASCRSAPARPRVAMRPHPLILMCLMQDLRMWTAALVIAESPQTDIPSMQSKMPASSALG